MENIKYIFREEIIFRDPEDSSVAISRARDIHDSLCRSIRHGALIYILGRNGLLSQRDPILDGFWAQLLGGNDARAQAESLKLHSVTSIITCQAGSVYLKVTLSDEASQQQSASMSIRNDGKFTGFGK